MLAQTQAPAPGSTIFDSRPRKTSSPAPPNESTDPKASEANVAGPNDPTPTDSGMSLGPSSARATNLLTSTTSVPDGPVSDPRSAETFASDDPRDLPFHSTRTSIASKVTGTKYSESESIANLSQDYDPSNLSPDEMSQLHAILDPTAQQNAAENGASRWPEDPSKTATSIQAAEPLSKLSTNEDSIDDALDQEGTDSNSLSAHDDGDTKEPKMTNPKNSSQEGHGSNNVEEESASQLEVDSNSKSSESFDDLSNSFKPPSSKTLISVTDNLKSNIAILGSIRPTNIGSLATGPAKTTDTTTQGPGAGTKKPTVASSSHLQRTHWLQWVAAGVVDLLLHYH